MVSCHFLTIYMTLSDNYKVMYLSIGHFGSGMNAGGIAAVYGRYWLGGLEWSIATIYMNSNAIGTREWLHGGAYGSTANTSGSFCMHVRGGVSDPGTSIATYSYLYAF